MSLQYLGHLIFSLVSAYSPTTFSLSVCCVLFSNVFSVFSLCLYLSLTSPLLLKLLFHSCPPLHPISPFYAISYGISYLIQNTALSQLLRKKCNFIPAKTRTTGPRWVLEKWKILSVIFFPISIHNWKSQIILLTCPLESKLRHKVSDCKSSGSPSDSFQNMTYLLRPPILVTITDIP